MPADVPHDHIRETHDRSWTIRLLELVAAASTPDDDREQALQTLEELEDHRSVAPLRALLEDPARDPDLRRAVSEVLGEIDWTTTVAQRSAWWESGDDVLRAHAVGFMERSEATTVMAVASADGHPQQVEAVAALAFHFGEAEFMEVLVRALDNPDPAVRAAAAKAVVWDEPAAAEQALVAAASDVDPDAAEYALLALCWYPTRHVVRALSELELHDDGDVRDQAADTLRRLLDEFERAADDEDPQRRALIRAWMAPVADLIEWDDEPAEPAPEEPSAPSRHVALPVAAHEIQAMLADPDGEWRARLGTLRQVDWAQHSVEERAALKAEFSEHPDPEIRWTAAKAFRVWGERDELVLQLLDADAEVRGQATQQLGELEPDPALAPIAWACMLGTAGSQAGDAINAYARHADPAEARADLTELVRDDPREEVRLHAIWKLFELRATSEFATLVPLLSLGAGVTWDVHIELLDAMAELGVAVPEGILDRLATVDHLELAVAVAGVRGAAVAP